MNYTENYHLPQWEETDRIMRVDFNEAMAGIEEGMTAAQTSADAAAELPYVIGQYTAGTPFYTNVELGFRPRALLIAQAYNGTDTVDDAAGSTTFFTQKSAGAIEFMEYGFRASRSHKYPNVNREKVSYVYIAFR